MLAPAHNLSFCVLSLWGEAAKRRKAEGKANPKKKAKTAPKNAGTGPDVKADVADAEWPEDQS